MADPVIEIQSGFVRGLVVKHEDGFDYYAFKGIPYAEPPLGELRFEDPVPKKPWTGVIECKKYASKCLQFDMLSRSNCYNENCLYLNVFTRSINEMDDNPVIVVIHGEGFIFGSVDDFFFGPEYLIRKNLVIVTLNYRLGILGFLNLEDEIAPGNQGLKDQVMVLKWVQENIRSFGGNPDNVTVFGVSAGSACTHYLALSPDTQGLINKVILHGVTLYTPFASCHHPRSNAIQLCSMLGQRLTDSKEIVKFLKSVDAKRLLEAQELLRIKTKTIPFVPGPYSRSSNPYLPIHPHKAGDEGVHLPCLVGYTNSEGVMVKEDYFKICDRRFENVYNYNTRDVADRYFLTANQVRRLYYNNETVSDKNLDKFVNFAHDFYFLESLHKFIKVQAEKSSGPTYVYQFNYCQPDPITKHLVEDCSGLGYYEVLSYLFKLRAFDVFGMEHYKKGTRPYKMMEQMTEMWANFATYGRPTVEKSELTPVHWLPINDGKLIRHLNIDTDITMQSTLNVDQKLLSAKNIKD